jgi:cob(I)alamin adenosyltransferase
MSIATRTGDRGETSLLSGDRVPKTHPRITACGSVDELNAHLGCAAATTRHARIRNQVTAIQEMLFLLGADVSDGRKPSRCGAGALEMLDEEILEMERELPRASGFLLPGGTATAAHLHVARAVCRRAERDVFALVASGECASETGRVLNRLSDHLFLLARIENALASCLEACWKPPARPA